MFNKRKAFMLLLMSLLSIIRLANMFLFPTPSYTPLRMLIPLLHPTPTPQPNPILIPVHTPTPSR